MPCYMPEPDWPEKLLDYYGAIAEKLSKTELFVVIVNDGTPGMVAETDLQMLRNGIKNFSYYSYTENRGKGFAIRYGIARVVTTAAVYTDLDLPYTAASIVEVATLLADHDVVIGIKSQSYYSKVPVLRKIISKWLRVMIGLCFPGIITTDTQCGLKGLKGRAKDMFMKTRVNDFLFDLEFIAGISPEQNLDIVLQEIHLRENVTFGRVALSTVFRELYNFLRILFSRRSLSSRNQ